MERRDCAIAVGVADDGESTEALLWAVGRAKRARTGLELVHALATSGDAAEASRRRAQAAEFLAQAAAPACAAGVPVRSTVLARPPGPALVDVSQRVDLLVVGRRLLGDRVRNGSGGSVGRHVSRYAGCPVVVVPQRPASSTGRVVVHLTGRSQDRAALSFAFDHAASTGAELEAVYAVLPVEPEPSPLFDQRSERARRAAEILLAEELAGYGTTHPQVRVLRHTVQADPRDALLWASAHADLLVLHAPEPSDGLLSRASGEVPLGHSHCPVAFTR